MTEGTPPPADQPVPPSPEPKAGNFWSRRSRRGKILIVVGAVVLLFVAIGAFSDPPEDSKEAAATTKQVTPQETPTTTEAEPEQEEEPAPEPAPKAPLPIVLRGSGAQVETVTLAADSPAVVAAVHRGSSNFIVELVTPGGSELLVNDIGNYSGEIAYAGAAAGRYRLRVDADGSWTVSITQPVPRPRDKTVPTTLSGRGADVVKIRTDEDLQPIVEATHRGQSNFIVSLIGYGDTSGDELIFNEIGNFSGETIVNDMPTGSYLLAVQADGPWTVKFSP